MVFRKKEIDKKNHMIHIHHLYYMVIIFALVIASFVVYIVGGGDAAGRMLNFAATLASIILAVIAILMTIVDLGGQRNTIADLKETANTLSENLEKANDSLSDITNLKDDLMNSMINIQNNNNENSSKLEELIERFSSGNNGDESKHSEKIKELIDELKTMKVKYNRAVETPIERYYPYNSRSLNYQSLSKLIKNILKDGNPRSMDQIMQILNELDISVTRAKVRVSLKYLIDEKAVQHDGEGRYSISGEHDIEV
ncbi:hypothetical protein RYX56_19860 [Alkalihalophilus lindianensis]|uniref:Uncharacterized protein n=1 Tax=Alkalihalophilus lindianensis TaxID=1630542 RepID=A0ABU3XFE8_9BACI|nr:hypothetical protein [Alkalihalophilus lindianensis]MDV2686618.1 hypothetical protein [Alkalihalophilus lindianensis]